MLHFTNLCRFPRPGVLLFFFRQCSPPSSSASAAVDVLSLAHVRSIPSFSHHPIPTCAPSVLFVSAHSSRRYLVVMNFTNVLCLLRMYSSIASNTASSLAAAVEVYSYFPSIRRDGSLPVNGLATWSWNPPRIRPM